MWPTNSLQKVYPLTQLLALIRINAWDRLIYWQKLYKTNMWSKYGEIVNYDLIQFIIIIL